MEEGNVRRLVVVVGVGLVAAIAASLRLLPHVTAGGGAWSASMQGEQGCDDATRSLDGQPSMGQQKTDLSLTGLSLTELISVSGDAVTDELADGLDEIISGVMISEDIPNLSIAVLSSDRRLVAERAYSNDSPKLDFFDGEVSQGTVDVDHPFRLGSVSKLLTGLGVLAMIEDETSLPSGDGLALDTQLNELEFYSDNPGLANLPDNVTMDGNGYYQLSGGLGQTSIRRLLRHRWGFSDSVATDHLHDCSHFDSSADLEDWYADMGGELDSQVTEDHTIMHYKWEDRPAHFIGRRYGLSSLPLDGPWFYVFQLAEWFSAHPHNAKFSYLPKGEYNYSNAGFLILGEVIRSLDPNSSYEDYILERVFGRAGAVSSAVTAGVLSERQSNEVSPYVNHERCDGLQGFRRSAMDPAPACLSSYNDPDCLEQYEDSSARNQNCIEVCECVPFSWGYTQSSAWGAAGAWISTPRDLLRVAGNLLRQVEHDQDSYSTQSPFGEHPILSAESIEDAWTRPDGDKDRSANYGMGWFLYSPNKWAYNPTAVEVEEASYGYSRFHAGHTDGVDSLLYIFPELPENELLSNVVVVILANRDFGDLPARLLHQKSDTTPGFLVTLSAAEWGTGDLFDSP